MPSPIWLHIWNSSEVGDATAIEAPPCNVRHNKMSRFDRKVVGVMIDSMLRSYLD